ncbi:DUF2264 domain-containing protein [Niabella hibiscisoli]|uniref:DUF2264 domain-containing protein n=1 Tax=Niabella hibiscisoli TaxID=1825928 RepID=UPI001F10F4F2|nr:DUF2264 domain-containing protein [Niabella hibiscisoli]MCH5716141.1 DUF2264 domain-containing protein [Niabella hibiscisoli]
MPLEKGPEYYLNAGKVSYLEAVGRCFAGIAPWLELPDDNTEEGILRKKYKAAVQKGLTSAADPQSPDYLNFRQGGQPIVDAAYLAHAFMRAPKAMWEPLDALTRQRYISEFKSLRDRTGAYNNWLLFAAMSEGFLRSVGEQFDPVRIDYSLNKMREWYVGDSWYKDGDLFSMDYYNSYVIHPMLVDLLGSLKTKPVTKHSQKVYSVNEAYEQSVKRMVRYAEYLERIIAPDGTYPAYGRSVTYRTAAFQALAQTALMKQLPEWVSPAQVRCALTKVFYNMYEGNQNFDSKGWLVLGFNGHQPMMADQYTSTGSLYMATLGFLPLGLPATDKFWTDAAADWTTKKAWTGQPVKKDYKVEY